MKKYYFLMLKIKYLTIVMSNDMFGILGNGQQLGMKI